MRTVLLSLVSVALFAQLTPEQRVTDFNSIASLFAKRYGPANWKIQALGVNVFDTTRWVQRVRAAQSDLEYYEIALQYVAQLQDGHSSFRTPSNFIADLGLLTDIYDGRVLIEAIGRLRYPAAQFPFQVGDELVSLDGVAVERLIDEQVRREGSGNPRGARRLAADRITFRPQAFVPRSPDLPDTTEAVIRRADGTLETYTLTWDKTGLPLRAVPPVPSPVFGPSVFEGPQGSEVGGPEAFLRQMQNWSYDNDKLSSYERTLVDDSGAAVSRLFILGWGQRAPYFGLPDGFTARRGQAPTDNFFTGTYMANGLRIGYLRIPNFAPQFGSLAAVRELDTEIAYFKANTDGLVVDVSRNTGGGCVGIDYASRLIPQTFTGFSEQLRPTQSLMNSFESQLRTARLLRSPGWVISTLEFYLKSLQDAALGNRAMTGPIPACPPTISPFFTAATDTYLPARDDQGNLLAYDKPLIVLADELSVSFGDIFPAILQDNRRGPIVGMRTGGLGGSISGFPTGFYSEGVTTNTNSLVIRQLTASAPGLPSAPVIENLGVTPDIQLDYMTRENLINRGRPFVTGFTNIIVNEIRRAGGLPPLSASPSQNSEN